MNNSINHNEVLATGDKPAFPVIKIMHIIIGLNIGGAEQMLKRLLLSDFENKSNRVIVSMTNIGKIGIELQDAGFKVYALNLHDIWNVPVVMFNLMKIIWKYNPEIVQTWLYHSDLLGGLCAKLLGVRHIIWGIRSTDLGKNSYKTMFIRKICSILSYVIPEVVICVADSSRKKHIKLGYSAKKMVVIVNGFDVSQLQVKKNQTQELCLTHGIIATDIVIGSVGRFNELKAHDVFIKAAGLLMNEFSNLRFLLVGRNLDYQNLQLMQWIAATRFPDRFILLGERTDVPTCLSAMDIFCLHSCSEGFPNVLGEAMGMGLPCVATDVGDTGVLLGKAGVLVKECTSQALVNGLKELIQMQPYERSRLGGIAAERIKTKFTIAQVSAQFRFIYSGLIK